MPDNKDSNIVVEYSKYTDGGLLKLREQLSKLLEVDPFPGGNACAPLRAQIWDLTVELGRRSAVETQGVE
jgi:hypothetical protein